ncbi:MAG: hypothetical protein JSR27_00695 [Proteobacteria bacterium]|nr:hypothetical protein [Pseudomonadota bacterium]
MKSSPTSTTDDPRREFFVREAGIAYRSSRERDPFEAWISLMDAVEALCPRWPERERRMTGEFKL